MKKKLNVKNLIMVIIHIISLIVIIYDLTTIIIHLSSSWTLFGFFTFCIAVIAAEITYEYFANKKRK